MNKTYNYMVNVSFYNRALHQEFFIDEESAKEYANQMTRRTDTKAVEFLVHQRYGYKRIKLIIRHHEGAHLWTDKETKKEYIVEGVAV